MNRMAFVLLLLAGCSSAKERKPEGTPTDPVEVCERVADVCRLEGAKLGVCVTALSPEPCKGRVPCFTCMSQH
jgi:hypothetical protein